MRTNLAQTPKKTKWRTRNLHKLKLPKGLLQIKPNLRTKRIRKKKPRLRRRISLNSL